MSNLILAILFLVVSLIKLRRSQIEHFWTRFVAALWFFLISFDSGIPDKLQHQFSINIIAVILVIEIVSVIFRKYWTGKK